MYFSIFPKGYYDLLQDGNPKLVTDLMRRVKIRTKVLDEISLYDPYDVIDGDTPESIAFKHFGNAELHWVILITNNITDRFYGWPLTVEQFETYVNDKYTNPDGTHHYEITQSSGKTAGEGPTDFSHLVEVNSTVSGATAVSNREYEQRLQDQKRQIKLLNPAYLSLFIEEFQDLISE
jgi:hypothetical protein